MPSAPFCCGYLENGFSVCTQSHDPLNLKLELQAQTTSTQLVVSFIYFFKKKTEKFQNISK
jgi:hypothetical protein